MRIAAIALVLAGCFSKPDRPGGDLPTTDGVPTPNGWLTGFAFRKRIVITAPTSTELTDFPVGIVRTADAEIAEHTRSGGRDLVATDDDGVTQLPSELVSYDAGTLEMWVNLPRLTSTQTFYIYYGGSSHEPDPSTWSARFAGVWHLSTTGSGAQDSTAHGNHLTSGGNAVPTEVAGAIGNARHLDGIDDSLDGGDPATGTLDFGTGSFSYSMWVFQASTVGSFDTAFYKGGTSTGETGYCWLLGSPLWTAKVQVGSQISAPELGSAALFQNRWVHIAAVVDRAQGLMFAYADGMPKSSETLAGFASLSTGEPIQVGRGTQSPFAGAIDELRVYNEALTPDWIKTEVANTNDPTFVTVGDEEAEP